MRPALRFTKEATMQAIAPTGTMTIERGPTLGEADAEAYLEALAHLQAEATDALVYTDNAETFLRLASQGAESLGFLKEVSLIEGVIRTGRPIAACQGRFRPNMLSGGYLPKWTSGPTLWVWSFTRPIRMPVHGRTLGLIVLAGRNLPRHVEAGLMDFLTPDGRMVRTGGTR